VLGTARPSRLKLRKDPETLRKEALSLEWLNVEHAAAYLHKSESSIQRMRKEGVLPNQRYWTKEQLREAMLKMGAKRGTPRKRPPAEAANTSGSQPEPPKAEAPSTGHGDQLPTPREAVGGSGSQPKASAGGGSADPPSGGAERPPAHAAPGPPRVEIDPKDPHQVNLPRPPVKRKDAKSGEVKPPAVKGREAPPSAVKETPKEEVKSGEAPPSDAKGTAAPEPKKWWW